MKVILGFGTFVMIKGRRKDICRTARGKEEDSPVRQAYKEKKYKST